tara:strand:- start:1466 stop:5746 length:4281 start_codon:yes stop_codon:yes gene_type:complete
MTGFTTAGARGGLFNQIGGNAGGASAGQGGGSASIIDWANVTNKPDPVITLTGSVEGSAIMTDLGDLTINTVSDVRTIIVDGTLTPAETGISITQALDVIGDAVENVDGSNPPFTTIVVRSENWTDPINLGSRIQIKQPLNGIKFIVASPLVITEGGSFRMRGGEDEFFLGYDGITVSADNIPLMRADAGVDGSGNMTLPMEYLNNDPLQTGRSASFAVGNIVVIRGCLDPLTGASLQKMFAKVVSIDAVTNTITLDRPPIVWEDEGDIARINALTNLTVVAGTPMQFYDAYYQPDGISPLTNPYSGGTDIRSRIQIIVASEMTIAPPAGSQYYAVENASLFTKGDMVYVMDDRSEDDFVEPDVGFGYSMNRTTASVVDVDTLNNHLYLDRVVEDSYDLNFFPRIIKVKPVRGVDLVINQASYGSEQLIEFRNFYLAQLDFCVTSSVSVKEVIGYDKRRAAAIRISSSMHCRVYDSKILGATGQTTGGIGYGIMIYYSSDATIENCYISGCRHAILAQHSSYGRVQNNYIVDDYISAIDIHGTASNGWIITNNQINAILRNENGPADNRSGIKVGNQSHPLSDSFTLIANNQISGYTDTDNDGAGIDIVPPARNLLITGNMIKDCYAGVYLGQNSSTRVLFDVDVENMVITNNYVQGSVFPVDITGATPVANIFSARDVVVKDNNFIECDNAGKIDLVDYVYASGNTHRSAGNVLTSNYVTVTNAVTAFTPDINSLMDSSGVVRIDTDGSGVDAYLPLTVSATNNELLNLVSTDSTSRIKFADAGTTVSPQIGSSGNDLSIRTNNLNRLTVKETGDLVIGAANSIAPHLLASASAVSGVALANDGSLRVGMDSAYAARFNRHTTFGELVGFYVNGVEAGQIKSQSDGTVDIEITGQIVVGDTVDGRDIALDGTKLDGIELLADVTDVTNVTAAGAVMDSELVDIIAVKALNQGVATTDSPTFATVNATAVNATTFDTTDLEVTNIKAKDGAVSSSIADVTGVMTIASSVLTTTDINGGTADGVVIGGVTPLAGTFTSLTATGDITVTGTVDGRDVAADGATLDGLAAAAPFFNPTTVTGYTPSLDVGLYNYFSGGTFDAATTLSFSNVPAGGSRWTYSAPIGASGGHDLTYAQYDNVSWSTSAEETTPYGIAFKSDGLVMYIIGNGGDDVNEFTLSAAYDISSPVFVQKFSVSAQDLSPLGVHFSPSGLEMYVAGNTNSSIYQYTLGTAWNVSTAVFTRTFAAATWETSVQGVTFKSDGTEMYVVGDVANNVNQFTLSVAWDISTATITNIFSVASQDVQPNDVTFNPAGTVMLMAASSNDAVYQYSLGTAWDVSTAVFSKSFSVTLQDGRPEGLAFNSVGDKMFVVGGEFDNILQYSTPTFSTVTMPASVSNTPVVDYSVGKRVTFEFVTLDGGVAVDVVNAVVV